MKTNLPGEFYAIPDEFKAQPSLCETFVNSDVLPANNAPTWHDGLSRGFVKSALNPTGNRFVPGAVKGYFVGKVSINIVR
jgi:hypothetical protein